MEAVFSIKFLTGEVGWYLKRIQLWMYFFICTPYCLKSCSKFISPLIENFCSLEHFKISSDLRRISKSDNFVWSFTSICLNTNTYYMKINHKQTLLFLHISVKFEYCENSLKIFYHNFKHFLSGFKNSVDFLTWWFGY